MSFILRCHFLHLRTSSTALFAILVFAFFATANPAYAQRDATSIVNVRVSDSQETPIFQADVRLLTFAQGNSPFRSFTDGAGRVSFSGVTRGSYYIEVGRQGYEPVRERVDVSAGSVENFSIRLNPLPATSSKEGRPGVVNIRTLAVPDAAKADFEKGQANLKSDPAQSIHYFREAVKKYSEFAEAYEMLGFAYYRTKQVEEAKAALKKAIDLNPKLPLAHTLLGKLYLEEKRFKESEKLLLESIRLDSQAWNAPYELARCYFNLGRIEDALTYARRAHDTPGAASTTHLLLVDIYLRRGDREKALRELEEFAKADPDSPLIPRVRQMIERLSKQKRS